MKFLILSLCLVFSATLTAKECKVTSANEFIIFQHANCNNLNKQVEIVGLMFKYDDNSKLDIIAGSMPQPILNGLCKNFGLKTLVKFTSTIWSADVQGVYFTKEDLSEGGLINPTIDGSLRPMATIICK